MAHTEIFGVSLTSKPKPDPMEGELSWHGLDGLVGRAEFRSSNSVSAPRVLCSIRGAAPGALERQSQSSISEGRAGRAGQQKPRAFLISMCVVLGRC